MRRKLTEVEAERMLDRRVQRRLSTDRAYNAAESSEAQSLREREIEAAEEHDMQRTYEIPSWEGA